ncbi:MAG: hypothetical protein COB08_005520 [Rhodobacteraceae bacterium]|nr:hypothetical protein [Paracoccaceae bacterium]
MMDIYESFSCHTLLPVKIDDVLEYVKDYEADCEIIFYPDPELKKSTCWSYLHSFVETRLYGKVVTVHRIVHSTELDEDELRLAVCKELLHILDKNNHKAASTEDVIKLIDQICIPANAGITMPGFNDHTGALRALAILLPRDALDEIKKANTNNSKHSRLTAVEISIAAEIPVGYVRVALTDEWERLLELIQ